MPQPVIRGPRRNGATDSVFAVSQGCATNILTVSIKDANRAKHVVAAKAN